MRFPNFYLYRIEGPDNAVMKFKTVNDMTNMLGVCRATVFNNLRGKKVNEQVDIGIYKICRIKERVVAPIAVAPVDAPVAI